MKKFQNVAPRTNTHNTTRGGSTAAGLRRVGSQAVFGTQQKM